MNGFTFNKIAGAVLGTVLVGFLIIEVSHQLYPSPRDEVHLAQMGYPVADAQAAGGDHGNGTEVVDEGPDLATLLANASAESGEASVRACVSCHTFEDGGSNRVGPNLWDIVGRPVASHDGFNYSNAMEAQGGNWTFERLFAFLQSPRAVVPGTTMGFAGIRRDAQLADVLAYLRTLSNSPVALPGAAAPAPAETHAPAEVPMDDTANGAADDDAADDTMDLPADDGMDHDAAAMDDAAEDTGEMADDAQDVSDDTTADAEDAAEEGADDTEDDGETTE